MNYKEYDDNELLSYAAENNEDAIDILYKKYEPLIYKKAKHLFSYGKNTGLELNDLVQEGLVGLNQAIQTFNGEKDTLFFTYAVTCIERKMISTITATKRQKHRILNESISLEYTSDDEEKALEFLLEDKKANPEEQLIHMETEKELISQVQKTLTDLESQVFELKLNDFNYREIADILDRDPKVIDNALQRIKLKIKDIVGKMD